MIRKNCCKILINFIIYSIIGFFMETVYAIFTKGLIESRKSFLYGPFCIVYGLAAIILILSLNKIKGQKVKLFIYGMILGCMVEYITSYIGEAICHIKWWDYSDAFLNINGRTCLYYAVIWGFLSIILIEKVNPFFDNIISNILSKDSINIAKLTTFSIIAFMIFDAGISIYAIDNFLLRVSQNYNININGIDKSKVSNLNINKIYSNDRMMMNYPNIIIVNDSGDKIYLESILSDVKNYYYSFNNKF